MTTSTIVAVASGKGGVGKTWLSVTLAQLLARSGHHTLLFDGDIGLANIDVQLGLAPHLDLDSVFAGKTPLEKATMHYAPGGFDLIAGRSGSGTFALISPETLGAFVQQLRDLAQRYEVTVLDLAAGIEQQVRMLSRIADKCIVVVTDEPTSLTDSYAFIKLHHRHQPECPIQIVVNQAETQRDGEKTYAAISRACQTFLHFAPPLLGIVRRDSRVKEAIRHQTGLITRSPTCTAATDVAALAVKLMTRAMAR